MANVKVAVRVRPLNQRLVRGGWEGYAVFALQMSLFSSLSDLSYKYPHLNMSVRLYHASSVEFCYIAECVPAACRLSRYSRLLSLGEHARSETNCKERPGHSHYVPLSVLASATTTGLTLLLHRSSHVCA